MSPKTRKSERDCKPLLDVYRKLFPKCQYCGRRKANDIHELLPGPLRRKARQHRSCILHLCRACHDELQHAGLAKNLAVKFYADPKGFDLLQVNELRQRDPLTMKDIEKHLPDPAA